ARRDRGDSQRQNRSPGIPRLSNPPWAHQGFTMRVQWRTIKRLTRGDWPHMEPCITINNARLHNLKNVTLSIPKGKLVVLTGISGSGKSTLGFDILMKEGLRQYLESVGMVAFGLEKPPV